MDKACFGFRAITFNESVYIFGGTEQEGVVGKVRYFSPNTKEWNYGQQMTQARTNFDSVIIRYKEHCLVYVLGGQSSDSSQGLKHCERYCPVRNKWEGVADMRQEHWGHSAISMPNGLIFVIGGFVAEGEYSNVIESYDIIDNIWTEIKINLNSYPKSGVQSIPH